jgi:hypothetical protein
MYDVTITNNFIEALGGRMFAVPPPPAGTGYRMWSFAPNGGKDTVTGLGNFLIEVPGMGNILFLDLGNRKLPGYTNPKIPWTNFTWGGLIRYRSLDAYFRYEAGGKVDVVVNPQGSISLTFAQGGMMINLDDLSVG